MNFFLLVTKLIRDGICPSCYGKVLHKSGISSYHCPNCDYTITVEKDYIIYEWYVIKDRRRVLRSMKLHANEKRWKRKIEHFKKHRKS